MADVNKQKVVSLESELSEVSSAKKKVLEEKVKNTSNSSAKCTCMVYIAVESF